LQQRLLALPHVGQEQWRGFDAPDGGGLCFWPCKARKSPLLRQRLGAKGLVGREARERLLARRDVGLQDFLHPVELAALFFDAHQSGAGLQLPSLFGRAGLHKARQQLRAAKE